MKLRGKMLLSYCVLIAIWLAVFFFAVPTISGQRIKSSSVAAVESSLSLTEQYLAAWVEETERLSLLLLKDRELQRILLEEAGGPSSYQAIVNHQSLAALVAAFNESYRMQSLTIYLMGDSSLHNMGAGIGRVADIKDSGDYLAAMAAGGQKVWSVSDSAEGVRVLRLTRVIRNINRHTQPLGVVRIEIPCQRVNDLLGALEYGETGSAYLVDGGGSVLASNRPDRFGRRLEEEDSVARGGVIQFTRPMSVGEWQLVYRIARSELNSEYFRMLRLVGFLVLLISLFTLVLSVLFSRAIQARLKPLNEGIARMEAGDFGAEIPTVREDEIGPVEKSFNRMCRQIRELFDIVYARELAVKDAELKVLQSQINPHFLYNTLETISWKAYMKDDLEVMELVNKLARFFRLTIITDQLVVPLEEELRQLETYVDIQTARHGDRVRVEFDVDESARQQEIVKLTLQPLVENAYVHGVLGQADRQGLILVRVKDEGDCVRIEVSDNGSGFDPEHQAPTEGLRIGLGNIEQRLRVFFEDRFSMRLQSEVGKGTVVTLFIQKIDYQL